MSVKRWSGTAWVNYAGADTSVVSTSTITAKGDLIVATAAGTVSNLAVGANNTILTADSTQTTGLKWVTATRNELMAMMGAL